MRFFLPSVPAGRIEYIALMLVAFGVQFYAAFDFLELSVDIANRDVGYVARHLDVFIAIYVVAAAFQWITAMRRLNGLGMSTSASVAVVIPGIGLLYAILLLVADPKKSTAYSPYGDDPHDPNAWVQAPNPASTAPSVTYQGQALLLPGDGQDEQAAA